jgi:hypothetical protein
MTEITPAPLAKDVVVLVETVEGELIVSPLMPGFEASNTATTIRMLRDDSLYSERRRRPQWLADDFDYHQVSTVRTQYRALV